MAKVPGSIWVEVDDIHYIDQFGREWYCPAYGVVGGLSAQAGSLWVEANSYLFYINAAGTVKCYPQTPYGDVWAPANAVSGSIWVGSDNQLHYITDWPGGTGKLNIRTHNDTAPVSTHTDAHQDAAHTDVPHTDVPHNDVHSDMVHSDVHTDVPHGDHWDSAHGDTARVNFGDHVDCYSDYLGQEGNLYYWYLNCASTPYAGSDPNPYGEIHSDEVTSSTDPGGGYIHDDRSVHWDFAHTDTHTDVPHNDRAPQSGHTDHWDAGVHTDVPHSDIAHNDIAHTDAHQDSHTDTPHIDYPIYIGP